jgi:Pentapeptide repeats (8 copies)
MANPEQVAKLKQHWNPLPGVPENERWNRWRLENPRIIPDLTGADLCSTILNNADLRGADLRGALFGSTNLRNAALRGADLTGANLTGADFVNADLRGADMSETILFATTFANTNMCDVKGLDTCIHKAPSSVGLDTFFRSNGELPDTFLRGCGVPEHFITYARSLIGQPIEFYSCFISYSSHDQPFAERLHAQLARAHETKAGVYGAVLIEGTIQPGDEIRLIN